jgi:hypothetical protein
LLSGSPYLASIRSKAATFFAPNRLTRRRYAALVRKAGGLDLTWNLSAYMTSSSSTVSAR